MITCDYRQMEVVFKAEHLYGSPDEDQFGLSSMTAHLNDNGCNAKSDSDGNYKMSFKLEKCGTSVEQSNGQIVFRNRIEGNQAASTVQGVVMTSLLGLDVSCVYGDNFELLVDDMYINIDDIDTGDDEDDNGQSSSGDVSSLSIFRMELIRSSVQPILLNQSLPKRRLLQRDHRGESCQLGRTSLSGDRGE